MLSVNPKKADRSWSDYKRVFRNIRWLLASPLFYLAAVGCSAKTADQIANNQSGCILNATVTCNCTDGSPGVTVCTDGVNYSPCQCFNPGDVGSAGAGVFDGGGAGAAEPAGGTGAAGEAPPPVDAATAGAGGVAGEVAAAGAGGVGGAEDAAGAGGVAGVPPLEELELFSFFVTSLEAVRRLSGSQDGFGGDLRYGEADGLSGADKICTEIAEYSMPGAAQKGWRAFLSATQGGPDGGPVNAIDRVGEGPWYDRLGRIVAMNKNDLVQEWPAGADPVIMYDLPNEYGVPNHNPDGTGLVDNHITLTGTGPGGVLYSPDWVFTCHDWTSSVATDGTPHIGFSWRGGASMMPGNGWYTGAYNESGCAPLVNQTDVNFAGQGVGSSGGYGGFYCLALQP